MVDSWPISVIVGTILGFLSGLGIGGGSLLILWLTMVLEMPQDAARSINLLFFLPSAVIACCFRWKQGVLNLTALFPAIAAGCLGAAAGSFAGLRMDTEVLKKIFGGLLLVTGLREIFYKARNAAS